MASTAQIKCNSRVYGREMVWSPVGERAMTVLESRISMFAASQLQAAALADHEPIALARIAPPSRDFENIRIGLLLAEIQLRISNLNKLCKAASMDRIS